MRIPVIWFVLWRRWGTGRRGAQDLRNGVALKEGWSTTEAVAFGSVLLGVAELAVNVSVGSVAGQHRIEDAVALLAVEARLVPNLTIDKSKWTNRGDVKSADDKIQLKQLLTHRSARQHLLSCKDGSSASGTSILTFTGFDNRQIGSAGSHLLSITFWEEGTRWTKRKSAHWNWLSGRNDRISTSTWFQDKHKHLKRSC